MGLLRIVAIGTSTAILALFCVPAGPPVAEAAATVSVTTECSGDIHVSVSPGDTLVVTLGVGCPAPPGGPSPDQGGMLTSTTFLRYESSANAGPDSSTADNRKWHVFSDGSGSTHVTTTVMGQGTDGEVLGPGSILAQASALYDGSMTSGNIINGGTALESQTISFPGMPAVARAKGPVALTATATSGLPVSFRSVTPAVCTVDGSQAVLVGAGTCAITASQAGNDRFAAAPEVTMFFEVTASAPVVTAVPFTQIVALTAPTNDQPGITTYPITIKADATDDSGYVALHADFYSNNELVGRSTPDMQMLNGRQQITINERLRGPGPYYVCFWGRDSDGMESDHRGACMWLALEVPLEEVSNGCGSPTVIDWSETAGEGALWIQNFLGNKRHYGGHTVKVTGACNVHDAGYAGVTVLDPLRAKYVDFRPLTRSKVDRHFARDIRLACKQQLKGAAAARWLRTCRNGLSEAKAKKEFVRLLDEIASEPDGGPDGGGGPGVATVALAWTRIQSRLGADTYLDIVRHHGRGGYDADLTTAGTQDMAPPLTVPAGGDRTND